MVDSFVSVCTVGVSAVYRYGLWQGDYALP